MGARGGYLIKYQEIDDNISRFIKQIDMWISKLEELEKKYMKLTNFDGIRGETADAIKEDSNKFSLVAINHMYTVFEEYKEKVKEYKDKYSKVEKFEVLYHKYPVFSYDDFNNLLKKINESKETLDLIDKRINANISSIEYIVKVDIPSVHNILEFHEDMGYRIEELKHQIAECEMSDLNYTEESIDTLLGFLRPKDIGELETNFTKIDMIARGLYPDVKEDVEAKEFKTGQEIKEVSKDAAKEVVKTPETYEEVGKLTEKFSKIAPGECLTGSSKMEKVSKFFKGKGEIIATGFEHIGNVIETAEFIGNTNENIVEGYPAGQAVLKNGLSTIGAIFGGSVGLTIVSAVIVPAGLPLFLTIGAAATTVALCSYAGKRIGESTYYSIVESKLGSWSDIEYFEDGIHPKPQL